MREYNGKITGVTISGYSNNNVIGQIWVHRGHYFCSLYPIKSLTQYQRAVRLLNAFVERNMK